MNYKKYIENLVGFMFKSLIIKPSFLLVWKFKKKNLKKQTNNKITLGCFYGFILFKKNKIKIC